MALSAAGRSARRGPARFSADAYLDRLRRYGVRPSLERIRAALDTAGRPDQKYSIVLITGTNGKGTCAKMLSEILAAHGIRVGLYLSPHVRSYTERYERSGRRIRRAEFQRAVRIQSRILAERKIVLTEFEFLTFLAYRWFAEQRVSWAIVEAGMGGRWDATNAADPEMSIITSVGIDHVEFLGRTVERIARDKSGIARKNRDLLIGPVPDSVRRSISAGAAGARMTFFDAESIQSSGSFVRFGRRWRLSAPAAVYGVSAALALTAAERILRSRFRPAMAQAGLRRARLPGRFQTMRVAGFSIILDVAHNEPAFKTLFAYLRARRPRSRFDVILGMQRQKRGETSILQFLRAGDRVRIVRLNTRRTKPASMWRPFVRAARAARIVTSGPSSMKSAITASRLSTAPGTVRVVAGSFYAVRDAIDVLEALKARR